MSSRNFRGLDKNRDCIHTGLRLQRGDEHNKKRSLGSWRLLLLRVILIHLKGDPHHDVTAPEVSNLCLLYSDFIVEFTKRVERVPGDPNNDIKVSLNEKYHITRDFISAKYIRRWLDKTCSRVAFYFRPCQVRHLQ